MTVKLIKTLPHLLPLHIEQLGVNFYVSTYSPQVEKYFTSAQLFTKETLRLNKLVQVLRANDAFSEVTAPDAPYEYSLKGDILLLWPVGYTHPVRIEFYGEQAENIRLYDELTGRTITELECIVVSGENHLEAGEISSITVAENTKDELTPAIFVPYITDFARQSPNLDIVEYDYIYPQLFWNRTDLLQKEIERLESLNYDIYVVSKHWDRLPEALKKHKASNTHTPTQISLATLEQLPAGYVSNDQKQAVFTDREIWGTIYLNQRKLTTDNISKLLSQFEGEIQVGDYIVHEDYGVAIYAGLTQEEVEGVMQEYLELHYAGDDKLLVPVSQVQKLTRYIGEEGLVPKLSALSKSEWERSKAKVSKSITILAKELLEHYARRELAKAPTISPEDSPAYKKFVSQFAYKETRDQIQAINEIVFDMQSSEPMNRLLVGDVGFGKTEIIMRAAFKAVEAGKQVAVLCPTTVLTAQHLAVFTERFKDFPMKIVSLSRFNTLSENRELVDLLNSGNVDIAIGTHRLLSKDIKFKELGLLIVDEEQRFGVRQKERIKTINDNVHHLAVSATPIPRTLSMALSSIQDISIIATPPVGRKPIITELTKDDWNEIVSAIQREISRNGQVYFVHNRVQTLITLKEKLSKLIPSIRISVAHGQMAATQLDKVMTEFYQHQSDVLLCTTIIENGLDLPNVNTIIIDRAHTMGLAQLYQLRGRVGRSDRQAYCYLFYEGKTLAEEPQDKQKEVKKYLERLQSLIDASELGSGFQVASRDLEIRGAGNLLGEQQHGHISKLGYALYMQLLAQEVERLKTLKDQSFKEYVSL